jgi:hypothetical protein
LRWRRLDLFAEIGAVEKDKGVVAPPTSDTDAWWAAVAAVRETAYLLRGRGLAKYVAAKNGALSPPSLLLSSSRHAEERLLDFTQRRVK